MDAETFDTICNFLSQRIEKRYLCCPHFASFRQNQKEQKEYDNDTSYNTMIMIKNVSGKETLVKTLIIHLTSNIKKIGGLQFTVGICYTEPKLTKEDEDDWTTSIAEFLEEILRKIDVKATVVCITGNTRQLMINQSNKSYDSPVILKEGNLIN